MYSMLKVFSIVIDTMSVLLMGSRMDILYYFVQVPSSSEKLSWVVSALADLLDRRPD